MTYKTDIGASEKATNIGSNVYLIEDLNGSSKVSFQVEATDGTSAVHTGEFTLPSNVVHMAVVQLSANGELKATFPDDRALLSDGTGSGGFNGLPSCATGVYCQIPDGLGHGGGGTVGATSDANSAAGFTVSDSFEALATTSITDICWWGFYVDFGLLIDCGPGINNFTVSYFADAGGLPGALIGGPFTGPADNFFDTGNDIATGIGPINEYQYELSHAPVAVNNGDVVHIQVQNNTDPTSCFWLWSTAPGDGAGVQNGAATDYDLGFCVNIAAGLPPPPPAAGNDNCVNALAIAGNGPHAFDNSSATDDGLDDPLCDFFGSTAIPQDVWFCWTSAGSGTTRMETCGQTTVDTKIAVYNGCSCPTGTGILACNDDDCGLQSGLSFNASAGNTYLLRVGTFPGATGGTGTFTMQQISVPANDLCADAIAVAVPSSTPGTTVFATTDSVGFPFCGTGITSPGVWYSVTGTGNSITASLCDGNTTYDSKISVYCGDCADPANAQCVVGIDDACGLQSEVTWCSQAGATYLVLIHGFGGGSGPFELDVSDDGVSCAADVACLPQGACCIDIGGGQIDCQITTVTDCATLGGTYQGDNTGCPTKEYFEFSCTQAFEQIANTGTPLFLGDDDGVLVPLGFTFNFFEQSYSTIGVGSNGYLTFGTDLTDFSNDAIPNSLNAPDDFIAPLWDDLNPGSAGQVYVATFGVAPNRAFVAQWDNVPQFGNTDSNTFQAILFENSSRISFRYLNITPQAFAGDYTVGVENVDGTRGTAIDASTIFNGDCRLLIPDTIPGDCTAPLPLDVRPGFCPNPILPNANGVVTVTVPGTVSVNPANATMVDGTVQLELVGGGAPVQPYRRSPTSLTYVVGDSVTPFFGSNCNVSGPDGIDDWTFEFSVADLRDAFGLGAMNPGATVQVQLSGRVSQSGNAQSFVAHDEMTVTGQPQGTRVRVISRFNGLFTPTSTDLIGDSGAFGGQAATRFVQPGSTFSVTAGPLPLNPGFVWVGWYMDGQFLTSNATANIVVGNDNVALTPVYIFVKSAGAASNF